MFDLVLHAVEGEAEGGFMDIVLDTLLDGVKLIPFLFIAFLIIELIEHKLSKKTEKAIAKAGQGGPIIGALLGGIPQCGFSVVATNLYITRIISLGTLISIYLSTSDEMIPVLLSSDAPITKVLSIVGIKILIGMVVGFIIDLVIRETHKKDKKKDNKNGFGLIFWINERKIFVGFWKNNKQNGLGKFISNENIRYGFWEEGKKTVKYKENGFFG